MAAVVFAGPSLAGATAALPPGVSLQGPAAAGDLYRAARAGARVIGLVDGVFEDRPTVWHKEILWALERGARVIGAASLGALRAAECAPFGMEGVGQVYGQILAGAIEDDSDLAVVHAPGALDWQPLTEARVNVRATLEAAAAAGVLSRSDARTLTARAAALPFRELTWPALAADLDPARRDPLAAWLPGGRVDLKRADALALLDAVAEAAGGAPAPPRTGFRLAETRYWRAAVAWFERSAATTAEAAVLDELRLDPARFGRALVHAFARRAAADDPLEPPPDDGELLDDIRLRHGLGTAAAFRDWLRRSRAEPAALAAALAAEERLAQALERSAAELAPAMLDALRLDGHYEALARRAANKRARLAGRPEARYRESELAALVEALCARRRIAVDGDLDLAARALGLAGRRELFRLLADEHHYAQALVEKGG